MIFIFITRKWSLCSCALCVSINFSALLLAHLQLLLSRTLKFQFSLMLGRQMTCVPSRSPFHSIANQNVSFFIKITFCNASVGLTFAYRLAAKCIVRVIFVHFDYHYLSTTHINSAWCPRKYENLLFSQVSPIQTNSLSSCTNGSWPVC